MSETVPYRALLCQVIAETGEIDLDGAVEVLRTTREPKTDQVDRIVAGSALRQLARQHYIDHDAERNVWLANEHTASGWKPVAKNPARAASEAAIVVSDTVRDDPLQRWSPGRDEHSRLTRVLEYEAMLAEAGALNPELAELARQAKAAHAQDWRIKLPAMFPRRIYHPFAPHHAELLDWVWSIQRPNSPRPFVAIWNRGSAKSALAELACVLLGHRRQCRYALYVSSKQDKADDHVNSIASLLESRELELVDPDLAKRRVGKYGASKGWRRNRLTTAAGFTVDAVGLDSDVRGARIDDDRPDLLVFDDIDEITDSPAVTEKKLLQISRDLLPTQNPEFGVVLFVQNVIHPTSIAARLADIGGAPYSELLATRIVSGPIPAVENLTFAERHDPAIGRRRTIITSGTPTWEGYDLEACQRFIDQEGIVAFLSECQHQYATLKGGMFDHIDWAARRRSRAEIPVLGWPSDDQTGEPVWNGPCAVWCDPAVTSTDRSDSCAVTVGGLAPDGTIWCLWSWEQVASPEEAMRVAIEAGMRWGAQVCGFETDQGGDTWEVVYRKVLADLLADPESYVNSRSQQGVAVPRYVWAKAGGTEGNLSKRQRIAQLVARYDIDQIRHLDEGAAALEAGLVRFPKYKPFDVADSWWHCWRWLSQQAGGESNRGFRARSPSRRGRAVPDVSPGI